MIWGFVSPLFKKFPTSGLVCFYLSVVMSQFFPFTLACRMLRRWKIFFNIDQSQI